VRRYKLVLNNLKPPQLLIVIAGSSNSKIDSKFGIS
jgi:hypothetical protein